MSNELLTAAWKAKTRTSIQKLVLARLADRAADLDDKIAPGMCWPGITSIADECCISKRSAFDAIKILAEDGFLKIDSGGGKHNTNTYRVLPNYAPPAPLAKPDRLPKEQALLPLNGAGGSTNGAGGSTNGAGGSTNGAPPAPQPSLTLSEPSKNRGGDPHVHINEIATQIELAEKRMAKLKNHGTDGGGIWKNEHKKIEYDTLKAKVEEWELEILARSRARSTPAGLSNRIAKK